MYATIMPAQGLAHLRALIGIPEAQRAVTAPADDPAAIGGKGDAINATIMPAQRPAHLRALIGIPEAQRAVTAAADNPPAIGGKSDATDRAIIPAPGTLNSTDR